MSHDVRLDPKNGKGFASSMVGKVIFEHEGKQKTVSWQEGLGGICSGKGS
jgi:hypothetical protein